MGGIACNHGRDLRERDMSFHQIRLDRHEGIALLALHRPDRMNAFTTEMRLEIVAALDECDADDAVRAVIFTGAGDRAYCAGAEYGFELTRPGIALYGGTPRGEADGHIRQEIGRAHV